MPPWSLRSETAILRAVCIEKPAKKAPGDDRGKIAPIVTVAPSPGSVAAQGVAGLGVGEVRNCWVTTRVTSTGTSKGTSMRTGVGVGVGELQQPTSHDEANSSKSTRKVLEP